MTRYSLRSVLALCASFSAAFGNAGGELAESAPQKRVVRASAHANVRRATGPDAQQRAAMAEFMRYSNSGNAERGRELVAITQSRDAALAETDAATLDIVTRRLETIAGKVIVPGPAQDKYGDPMYTDWGPIPYHDSPLYDGPRYHASFERETMPEGVTFGQDCKYYRGAFSHPIIQSPTDQTLWPGASQSYIQSGMMMHPGSMPSSVSRVITNNRW